MNDKELIEQAKEGYSLAGQGKISDIDVSESLKRFELAAKAGAFDNRDKVIVFWRLVLSESKGCADYAATLTSKTMNYLYSPEGASRKIKEINETISIIFKTLEGQSLENIIQAFAAVIFGCAKLANDKNIISIAITVLKVHLEDFSNDTKRMDELAEIYGGEEYQKFKKISDKMEKDNDKIFLITQNGEIKSYYALRQTAEKNIKEGQTIEEKTIHLK